MRIAAQAEADAVKLAADAEAYRLQRINEQLSEKTIQNTLAERWDGKLPEVMGAGATGILNLNDMLETE